MTRSTLLLFVLAGYPVAACSRGPVSVSVKPAVTPAGPLDKGRELARSGKYKEAIAELDRLAADDSTRAETFVARGEVHHRGGNAASAKRDFAEAIRLAGATLAGKANDPAALVARGTAHRFQKDYASALADLDAALKARPNDAVALRERGVVLRNLGRAEEAIASYDKSLTARPDDPVALNARGYARFTSGDPAGAVRDYRAALERENDYLMALGNRAASLLALGRAEEAVKDLSRIVALADDAPNRGALGRGKLLAGDAKGAVAELDKAIRLAPRDGGLYFDRAIACFHAGQFDACMADARRLQAAYRGNLTFTNLHSAARWAKVGLREPTGAEIDRASAKVGNARTQALIRGSQFADRVAVLPEGSPLRASLIARRQAEIREEVEAQANAEGELAILKSQRAGMAALKKSAADFPKDTEAGRAARRLILAGAKLKREGAKGKVVAADLSYCHLRDEEVALLRHFPALRTLTLSTTWTTDAGLRLLGGLRELRSIDLGATRAGDAAASWLGKLPLLERANLSETTISDAGLAMLLRSPGLKHLDLGGTTLSPAALGRLRGKKGWRSLSLMGLPADNATVAAIAANSPDLESLNLSGTKVTNAAMAPLGKHVALRDLRLANTAVSDAGLRELGRNKRWKWLDLTKTQVSDGGLAALTDMKDLQVLHLFDTNVTIAGLRDLSLENLGSLTVPSDVLTFRRDELRRLFPKAFSFR